MNLQLTIPTFQKNTHQIINKKNDLAHKDKTTLFPYHILSSKILPDGPEGKNIYDPVQKFEYHPIPSFSPTTANKVDERSNKLQEMFKHTEGLNKLDKNGIFALLKTIKKIKKITNFNDNFKSKLFSIEINKTHFPILLFYDRKTNHKIFYLIDRKMLVAGGIKKIHQCWSLNKQPGQYICTLSQKNEDFNFEDLARESHFLSFFQNRSIKIVPSLHHVAYLNCSFNYDSNSTFVHIPSNNRQSSNIDTQIIIMENYPYNFIDHLSELEEIALKTVKTTQFSSNESKIQLFKLNIAIQIATLLKEMHESGICWRDLKNDNILFNERGEVAFCDMGLATHYQNVSYIEKRTFSGTPNFVSIETLFNQPEVKLLKDKDTRKNFYFQSEIYSFGVVLYCLFYRSLPWVSEKPSLDERILIQKKLQKSDDPLEQLIGNIIDENPVCRPDLNTILTILNFLPLIPIGYTPHRLSP